MYINSPGGVVTAGLSIYDTMQFIRPKVTTLCIGQAASMGSLLLCAGEKGMRYALPNARIMVHQPSGGFQGQASDIQRHAEDILKVKRRLNEIYVEHTGQTYEAIERTLDRDHFMSAEEAKASASSTRSTTKRAIETGRAEADLITSRLSARSNLGGSIRRLCGAANTGLILRGDWWLLVGEAERPDRRRAAEGRVSRAGRRRSGKSGATVC